MPSMNFVTKQTVIPAAWLNEVDEHVFNTELSVASFGAVGDGVTDDAAAIQAACNALVNFAGVGKLIFPRTTAFYRITSSIVVPAGFARNTIDFQGSEIRYDGPVDPTAAVFSMTGNQIYFNTFENGMINANSKAGHCVYAVGAGWQYAIKANKFINCELRYATVVNVRIGDQTNTGNDQDGADWLFLKCYFRAITPALTGAILDGDNVFNTNFSHCFFNTDSGFTAAGHIRVLRAGSTFVYDAFFGNIDSAAYCIDHRSGILGVFGANSEEGSILTTLGMIEERKSIVLSCVMVNESTASATPEYAVYAPVGQITMQSCTFGKATDRARKVYAGDSLHATNVYLGSDIAGEGWGTYELDYPDRCSIEGQHLNSFRPLNGNPCMHLWNGSASGDLPIGYSLTGSGTVSVQRSTTSAVQGPYTARLTVAAGYATGNVIDGLQAVVPIAQNTKTGRRSITAVVRGSVTGLTGATTLKLRVNMIDASGTVIGSNVSTITPSGGNFLGMCSVVASDPSIVAVVAMIGIGTAAASGTIYLDNLYAVPVEAFSVNGGAHYKAYVDAWTKYAPPMDGMLEYLKAGQLSGGTPLALNKITWGTAAPTVGDHRAGDVVLNSAGSTGNPAGWMCTIGGTAGTWKPMANLA